MRFTYILLCLICSVQLCAGEILPGKDWKKAPAFWHNHYETALNEAKKNNKYLLVLQTAIWCGFCQRLKKDVLDTKEFIDLARRHAVLFYLDIPYGNHNMPASQLKYNRKIQKMLEMGGGYPTVKIFDTKGNLALRISGYKNHPNFMYQIYKLFEPSMDMFYPSEAVIPLGSNSKDAPLAKVRISHWGTEKNNINNLFHPGEDVLLCDEQDAYLKLEYTLPDGVIAPLTLLFSMNEIKPLDQKQVSRSGTYVYKHKFKWGTYYIKGKIKYNGQDHMFQIPCNILVRNVEKYRDAVAKKLFKQTEYEILGWKLHDEEIFKPFDPQKTIIVPPGKYVDFKLRYTLPIVPPKRSVIGIQAWRSTLWSSRKIKGKSDTVSISVRSLKGSYKSIWIGFPFIYYPFYPKGTCRLNFLIEQPCKITFE